MTTVSVCLAAYNGEQHIATQLRSILSSPEVGEVIVSDDGSIDRTVDIVRSFDDPRIRLVQGPKQGLIKNFESLLRRASGDYIFLSDQDDVWLPSKVEAMLGALRHADMVVSDCRVVDENLRELYPSFFGLRGSGPGFWRNLVRNGYLGCCMAFRRELLSHALPFPRAVPMHDWWLGLVAEACGRVTFLPEPLHLYRRHSGSSSTAAQASSATRLRQLRWRIRMMVALASRIPLRKARRTLSEVVPDRPQRSS